MSKSYAITFLYHKSLQTVSGNIKAKVNPIKICQAVLLSYSIDKNYYQFSCILNIIEVIFLS